MALTIADAFKLICIPDYIKYMEQICDILNRKPDSSFRDYVEAIMYDPDMWFNSFPEKLKSSSSLSKPKTALLNLLKESKVIAELGEDMCRNATEEVTNCWKKKYKNLSQTTKKDPTITDKIQKEIPVPQLQSQPSSSVESCINIDDKESRCSENYHVDAGTIGNHCNRTIQELETEISNLQMKNDILKKLLYKYVQKVHESNDNIALELYSTLIKNW